MLLTQSLTTSSSVFSIWGLREYTHRAHYSEFYRVIIYSSTYICITKSNLMLFFSTFFVLVFFSLDTTKVDLQLPMPSHSISWLCSCLCTSAPEGCTKLHGTVSLRHYVIQNCLEFQICKNKNATNLI